MKIKPGHLIGQAIFYGFFALTIGYFSASPPYKRLPDNTGIVKLSLTHPGQRKHACVDRTPEELAKLAPNMRSKQKCERERSEVEVYLEIDGKERFHGISRPAGLSKDGASHFYSRFNVPAGEHNFKVKMRDRVRDDKGYDYENEFTLKIEHRQIFVINFLSDEKRFSFF